MTDRLMIDAPAKINLNLKITGRRDDGYHLLDSVVIFAALADRLTISCAEAQPKHAQAPSSWVKCSSYDIVQAKYLVKAPAVLVKPRVW